MLRGLCYSFLDCVFNLLLLLSKRLNETVNEYAELFGVFLDGCGSRDFAPIVRHGGVPPETRKSSTIWFNKSVRWNTVYLFQGVFQFDPKKVYPSGLQQELQCAFEVLEFDWVGFGGNSTAEVEEGVGG
jgi:hypothetical protein